LNVQVKAVATCVKRTLQKRLGSIVLFLILAIVIPLSVLLFLADVSIVRRRENWFVDSIFLGVVAWIALDYYETRVSTSLSERQSRGIAQFTRALIKAWLVLGGAFLAGLSQLQSPELRYFDGGHFFWFCFVTLSILFAVEIVVKK